MKTTFLIITAVFTLMAPLLAQEAVIVVADPTADRIAGQTQGLMSAQHSETVAKWVESIKQLNAQLKQAKKYVGLAQDMKGYMGDPASIAGLVGLELLGEDSLGDTVGELTSELNKSVKGIEALSNDGQELFDPVEFKTPSGFDLEFNGDLFKSFSAIQKQSQNANKVVEDTLFKIKRLQRDKAKTLAAIKYAGSQSEVQKLQAKAAGIDGEIAALNEQQQTASNQLVHQDIANRNDQEMKARAAQQAIDKELAVSLENYSQWQGQIQSSRKPLK